MQTLKNLIYNSDLHNQVKSYKQQNTIIFYAFESTKKLIKRYGGVLQFHLTIKQNIVNIVFMGWNDFHQYTKAIQCDISYSELGQQPIQTINGNLSELIQQLCSQHWYPSDCKDPFRKRQQAGITPPVCVSKAAASENADENKAPNNNGKQQLSFDDALNMVWSQVQEVLKEINESSHDDKTKEFWKEYTPWKNHDYQEDTYILKADYTDVKSYIGEKKLSIRSNVLPQPYIGDPNADIWLLLMNPSYSTVDIFDLADEQKGINLTPNVVFNKGHFSNRIELLEAQYSFEFPQAGQKFDVPRFYVLDKNFRTVNQHDGRKPLGSYEWWYEYLVKRNICGNTTKNLSNFFVLESFPYHSKSFDGNTIKPWIHSKSHFLFWVKMVAYALANKRILLCRGMEIAKRVHDIAEKIGRNNADTNQIFVCKSESFSISTGNFFSYKDALIIEKMELDAENRFRTALGMELKKK